MSFKTGDKARNNEKSGYTFSGAKYQKWNGVLVVGEVHEKHVFAGPEGHDPDEYHNPDTGYLAFQPHELTLVDSE